MLRGSASSPSVSIGTSESPRSSELVTRLRGDDHLAGVRILERRPGTRCAVGIVGEPACVGGPAEADLVAAASRDCLVRLAEEDDVGRLEVVQPLPQRSRLGRPRTDAVNHAGAVRGRDDDVRDGDERRLQPRMTSDWSLSVVGAQDDGIAVEELVRPSGGVDERGHGGVAPRKRLVRAVGPVYV